MLYKDGDIVRIKSREWYEANKDEGGFINSAFFDKERVNLCGTMQTICNDGCKLNSGIIVYGLKGTYYLIGEEAIECIVRDEEDDLYKELEQELMELL